MTTLDSKKYEELFGAKMATAFAQFAQKLWNAAQAEQREADAKICDQYDNKREENYADICAEAIRGMK